MNKKAFIVPPCAVLLALVLSAARSTGASLEKKVQEHQLANGLQLLMVERHAAPVFSAYITIGVGSVDETSETRGVAHLLEHMLFKGTKTIGTTNWKKETELLAKIEEVGARIDTLKNRKDVDPETLEELRARLETLQEEHRRYVVKDEFARIYAEAGGVGYNAFTNSDLTTYVVSLPANKIDLWAAVEADRMQNAVLREFYTERDVVLEERRRSYETDPSGLLYESLLATAYNVHPYGNPTIGWRSDIENLTLAETREFLRKYYAPVNTVIALVGDIHPKQAIALVERYFGTIPAGTPVPPVEDVEPPQRGARSVRVQFDAEPQLAVAYHKPTLPSREDYVFDLIDLVLADGRTSRLYRALVLDKQLATSVATFGAPGSRYPNLFVIRAVPRHPHTVREVEQAIYAELNKLARERVDEAELLKARNRLRTDRLRYLQGNKGLAHMLTYYQTIAGDWRYLLTYDEKIADLTAADVMEVAQEYFRPANRSVAILGREEVLQ